MTKQKRSQFKMDKEYKIKSRKIRRLPVSDDLKYHLALYRTSRLMDRLFKRYNFRENDY